MNRFPQDVVVKTSSGQSMLSCWPPWCRCRAPSERRGCGVPGRWTGSATTDKPPLGWPPLSYFPPINTIELIALNLPTKSQPESKVRLEWSSRILLSSSACFLCSPSLARLTFLRETSKLPALSHIECLLLTSFWFPFPLPLPHPHMFSVKLLKILAQNYVLIGMCFLFISYISSDTSRSLLFY